MSIAAPRAAAADPACPPLARRTPREARLGQSVRLVAVTGYGQPEDRARAEAAGFDAHLVKPVDLDELRSVIERLAFSGPVGAAA